MDAPVEIEHVNHKATEQAVNDISDDTGVKNRLGNSRQKSPGPSSVSRLMSSENGLPLPDQKRKRDEAEDRERPDLPLEHPPRAPAVLDVREVEEPRNDGNRRGPLEVSRGEFLRDGVRQNEIRDNREQDEETLHYTPRSISLWHSMHVSTNGWLMSRGLRMSCPHDVQTPYVPSSMR